MKQCCSNSNGMVLVIIVKNCRCTVS